MPGNLFTTLVNELPALLTRKDMGKFFGSLLSPRYLANLDCLGKGPANPDRAEGGVQA